MPKTEKQTVGANIWACARAQAFENAHALNDNVTESIRKAAEQRRRSVQLRTT